VSEKLQGVTIVCGDYRESKSFIDGKTLAYFDPPCVEAGFGDKEHTELAKFADDMSARNAWIIATVADNCSANNNNSFFDKLYNGYEKTTLGVNRMVNSKKGWKEIGTFLINNKGYCL
jgi:DNA adenine methylase